MISQEPIDKGIDDHYKMILYFFVLKFIREGLYARLKINQVNTFDM